MTQKYILQIRVFVAVPSSSNVKVEVVAGFALSRGRDGPGRWGTRTNTIKTKKASDGEVL